MKIQDVPYQTLDFTKAVVTEHKGETGTATWHTIERGNIRARIVEYSPGYLADHWCSRGHVIYLLEGEMVNELKDGTKTTLKAGMGYIVEDDEYNPHRTYSKTGVKMLIVD